jgi:hypothetical protein
MIMGRAKLAYLAAFFIAATMLVLGGSSPADAHGLPHHPVASAAPSVAAAPGITSAPAAVSLEAEGRGLMRIATVLHVSDHEPPASDRSSETPCCGGALCHAGVAESSPEVSLLALTGAKLPLPTCYGSPARMPSGIERPPRRPSTI